MKRIVSVTVLSALVVLLSACGSAVKLDETKVEDRTPTVVGSGGTATSSGTSQNGVTTVNLVDTTKPPEDPSAVSARVVYFDYDSYTVRPEFAAVIEANAKYIKADKNRKVVIEGHTDERGGREYNLALGQRRAEAVRKALALLGVSDNQIEAVSFGKEKPAVKGSSEDAMAKNRRAEVSYR